MFTKIVVPLDGSACTSEAFDVALSLAKSHSGQLAVCSVVDPAVVAGTAPPSPEMNAQLSARVSEAQALIGAALEKAHDRGVAAEGETQFGVPFEKILEFAQRCHADTIVMGTHGRSGIKRLLFGSVAESVLRRSRCPVVVVNGRQP